MNVDTNQKFLSFKKQLKAYYESQKLDKELPTDEFLEWLIGFSEGDGCFTLSRKKNQTYKYLVFCVIQGEKNASILYKIRDCLGFGCIISQGKRVLRFVVQSHAQIKLIITLFNGNIVLPTRKKQFQLWLQEFKPKREGYLKRVRPLNMSSFCSLPLPLPLAKATATATAKEKESESFSLSANDTQLCLRKNKNTINLPSLRSLWLLGFVEAEGCFTISFLKNSPAFRVRFIVSQKGDSNLPILSSLITLFGGGCIEGHSQKDNFSYVISGLKNVVKIFKYFDKNLLHFQGVKKESYILWKSLIQQIEEKKHLDPRTREQLILKATQINDIRRKIK